MFYEGNLSLIENQEDKHPSNITPLEVVVTMDNLSRGVKIIYFCSSNKFVDDCLSYCIALNLSISHVIMNIDRLGENMERSLVDGVDMSNDSQFSNFHHLCINTYLNDNRLDPL